MRRRLAAVLCGVLLLVACAGGNDPTAGDASRLGEGGKKAGAAANGSKAAKKGAGKGTGAAGTTAGAAGAGAGTGAAAAGGGGAGGSGGAGPDPGIDPSLARASATMAEPTPDARQQGITPSYPEVLRATIEGLGKDFRITLEFDGALPERMDDDKTFMIVAVGMTYGQDDNYQVGARGDQNGWKPYAGGKFDRVEFPGTFQIDGSRMIFVIPWDFIHGPREFEWYVVSAWYRQLANTTHYKSDQVPNEGTTPFPG